MEKEGLVRSLTMLEERGVNVEAIVTDRHTGVQKFLLEERQKICHYFDPWHMGKGIGKKVDELGKKKSMQDVGLWRKSVVNHLYWSASTSTSGQEAVAKWTSVANHLQNVPIHDNALFPQCLHGPLVGEGSRVWLKFVISICMTIICVLHRFKVKCNSIKCFTLGTAACERLTDILLAPRCVKDVEKIGPVCYGPRPVIPYFGDYFSFPRGVSVWLFPPFFQKITLVSPGFLLASHSPPGAD